MTTQAPPGYNPPPYVPPVARMSREQFIEMLDGINRSRIARETGISMSTISRIFNGERRPSLNNAKKIALALSNQFHRHVSLDELWEILDQIIPGNMQRDLYYRHPKGWKNPGTIERDEEGREILHVRV